MNRLRTVVRELVGLFVDDGSFAALIVFWIAIVWGARHVLQGRVSGGIVLFAGLAAVLVDSVLRFARRSAKG